MTKISILYPNTPGARFDQDYYVKTHMPLSIRLPSTHPGFRGVSVERGVGGAVPGTDAAYIAMCHFSFTSAEDFLAPSCRMPRYCRPTCRTTRISNP